jgi:hypothetical protein
MNFYTAITEHLYKEEISFTKAKVHLPSFYTLCNCLPDDYLLGWNM